jgi:23S rRNA (uridine2552-2'-O)-methyltransferase
MSYNPRDHFFKKAKQENFAARSVFKLQEIDERNKVFKPGMTVLDLGAAPGSWSQYASKKIGAAGRVLGVDLTPVELQMSNAAFISADLYDLNLEATVREHGFNEKFDIVMSDMAPKTTGIKSADQAKSLALCELALDVARRFLKPKGTFICKLFHSGDFNKFRDEMRPSFEKIDIVKPKATRQISKEIFLVGMGFKN